MKVPFTWRPTGWFMVGFSADVPAGTAVPLEYFGQHLVAYRSESGQLHVLDGHCRHLGAHLGHNGKVKGDCIECPYHGWGWGPDGTNRHIPYEKKPNVSKRLRAWPVTERHEWIFVWHDPAGGPPRWELPDLFSSETFPALPDASPEDFYPAHPELSVRYEREPVHPQITLENAPDSCHFKYVHGASVHPVLTDWRVDGPLYHASAGWPVPTEDGGERLALMNHVVACGVGGSYAAFEGSANYRLAFFTTPVDDETSDLFYSIFWPREEGDASDRVPERHRERASKQFLKTLAEDLEIWRYQVYVDQPAYAPQDAKPYRALREWASQFYELDPV